MIRPERRSEFTWAIPKAGAMRTEGLIYASEALMPAIVADNAAGQVANVACLPGIAGSSLAMPDVHWGYGAPIGGVGAFDVESGVIVPGFVGYDINCGVRLVRTDLAAADARPRIEDLTRAVFSAVPSGVGVGGGFGLRKRELLEILVEGAAWAVERGEGSPGDLDRIEEGGRMGGVDTGALGPRALERGLDQAGTLGSGNHFLEMQEVTDVYDEGVASVFGLFRGQLAVMIHTGSRGLGHQVCEDYLARFGKAGRKYGIALPDRQLACAPVGSYEADQYLSAMRAAANFAFANRQIVAVRVAEVIQKVLGVSPAALGAAAVYDVAHNICKLEKHAVGGAPRSLFVHRKGATRAFPAGHPELPDAFRETGQPVIIPGTMGTASYVLVGTARAMAETWGSTCHGAGRAMSRHEAISRSRGRSIARELAGSGVFAVAASEKALAEEMPEAYKDVDEVIRVVEGAGISRKVARMKPLSVIKG